MAKICAAMLDFVLFACRVTMAYCVTSEPVPAVVGTATTGNALFSAFQRASVPCSGCAAMVAIALEESIGEPPPMPMKNSTPSAMASLAARSTVSTEGFSSISSNRIHAMPRLSSASVISCCAPFLLAEVFPVTTIAFLPSFAITSLCSATQPLPK